MAARKGHKKVGGRKPGSLNKTTASIKAALVAAFDQLGGVDSLVKWGEENRTEFYKLWAKLLPTEVKNVGAPFALGVVEVLVDAHDDGTAAPGAASLPAQ